MRAKHPLDRFLPRAHLRPSGSSRHPTTPPRRYADIFIDESAARSRSVSSTNGRELAETFGFIEDRQTSIDV